MTISVLLIAVATALQAGTAVPDTLEPARLPGMCLTLSPSQGTVSLPCDKSVAQAIRLPAGEAGPIRFGDLCLAPRGGGHYPPLFPVPCDGSPEQSWSISADGAVRNGANRCLSLLGLSSVDGTRIFGGACPTIGEPQTWLAKPADREIYRQVRGRIRWSGGENLCLSLVSASFMGLEACSVTQRIEQTFSFDRHDPGQFRSMGGCMTGFLSGVVRISDCAVTPSSTWMLLDGGLVFNLERNCLEPRQEGERRRWVVRARRCTAQPAQRWSFESVPPS